MMCVVPVICFEMVGIIGGVSLEEIVEPLAKCSARLLGCFTICKSRSTAMSKDHLQGSSLIELTLPPLTPFHQLRNLNFARLSFTGKYASAFVPSAWS